VIAAILCIDGGELEPPRVVQMVGAGLPFTPDAEGIWVEGAVGLGEARLWLSDGPSPRLLPTRDEQRGLVLAWDGRLDNREDLLMSLQGRWIGSPSDEELVLEAYARWEVMCVDHLLGDFAFVLWDGRARRLLAARDHMGVRPLHYAFDGRSVVVASRIGQVLEGARLTRRLNEPMIADYLSLNWNSPNETLFRDVWRVPAAHVLQHDQGARAPRVWRYWNMDVDPPIKYRSDNDYVEHFRDIAQKAVQSRLRTPHPIGVLLSGGLDSSTVACLASDLIDHTHSSKRSLATFTAIFDELHDADERLYVDPLVAHCGFKSSYVLADEMWTLRDNGAPHMGSWDEPFEGMFDGVIEGLFDRAKEDGVRVLLTGHGGDMLFCGSLYYLHDVLLDLGWVAFLRELNAWPVSRWPRLLGSYVLAPLSGLLPKHEVSYQVPEWVRSDFAKRIEVEQRLRTAYPPRRFRRPSRQFDFEAIAYVEFSTRMLWLQAEALRRGIDLRHPFFDVRLIDFCMRIPSWQKQRKGVSKTLIRSTMRNSLPPIVAERSLAGSGDFTKVLDRGLRERERHRWEACFATSFRLADLGYVDPVMLRRAFARYVEGEDALRWELALIFRLEQWIRHQDGERI
jgi:asparagine synthase (glutamine-hydrolysing)